MSALPENELDLEKLFLPAWAQEPSSAKHFAHYEGDQEKPERGGERRGRRPGRREGRIGERLREGRPRGDQRGQPRRQEDRHRALERERPAFPRGERRERREPPPPLPDLDVSFVPDEKGVESLARQIRTTGRAYPLFEIARLILQKPERYSVTFRARKKPDGQVAQALFACALDDTLWLSEDEAVAHVLKNHFATFYQVERTATEPPRGTYTFVAQCGMSGVILGPPNHHDYQSQLRRLHAQRFSRMPFEVFKSRVKIVRDEAVVKKWIDEQSWKTEYTCLNMPEPLRLPSREAVEQHFREVHKDNIIKSTELHTLGGAAARAQRSPELGRLVRMAWEDQKRFPLQIATALSQQFAARGLQFFKVNRAITHVSVARPHFLDLETTPVSEGVKRIVEFINSHPKSTRRQLVETLAPSPVPPPAPAAAEATVPSAEPVAAEAKPAAPEAVTPSPEAVTRPQEAVTPSPQAVTPPPEAVEPTPEQTAVIADLHWLIHQGHVIEFANGVLDTAKKPAPRPPKPEAKPAEARPDAAVEPVPTGEMVAEETLTEPAAVPPSPDVSNASPVAAPEIESGAGKPSSEPAPAAPTAEPESPAQ